MPEAIRSFSHDARAMGLHQLPTTESVVQLEHVKSVSNDPNVICRPDWSVCPLLSTRVRQHVASRSFEAVSP